MTPRRKTVLWNILKEGSGAAENERNMARSLLEKDGLPLVEPKEAEPAAEAFTPPIDPFAEWRSEWDQWRQTEPWQWGEAAPARYVQAGFVSASGRGPGASDPPTGSGGAF